MLNNKWLGFPGGASGKEHTCQGGRCKGLQFDPWAGRSLGERNGNPLQYSCLENSMDREACRLQSMRSQRVRHDCAHTHNKWPKSIYLSLYVKLSNKVMI